MCPVYCWHWIKVNVDTLGVISFVMLFAQVNINSAGNVRWHFGGKGHSGQFLADLSPKELFLAPEMYVIATAVKNTLK